MEVVRLVADCSRAKTELGWNPKRMSFKQHIDHLCDYTTAKVAGVPYVAARYVQALPFH